jgi:flagellar protein FliO/FliZ
MLDTLFGAEMPPAVRFLLAFLIVLGLIGVTAWAVRRFGAGRLGANTRGRQPRLAVIDYASVDGRRRLILVRRDNVEHLLMIGGPTDVVVEPNIVRATATPRDVPGARPAAGIDALPRAIPLPENGNGHGPGYWPLAPESNGGARPSPRLDSQRLESQRLDSQRFEPLPDELPPPQRPQRDPLSALADELTPRPAAAPRRSAADSRAELRRPAAAAAPPPAQPPMAAEASASADQNLAEMAQRLEAALRTPPTPRRTAPAPEQTPPASAGLPPAAPRTPRPSETKPERAEPNQGKPALYDNLEQEMASLLGRSNKT